MEADSRAGRPADAAASGPAAQVYVFGAFEVHVASLQLLHDGQPIALTPKVFDTLLVLLEHRHRVVSKDELMRLVWSDAFVSDDSLSQSISALRRVLGDDPTHPTFVVTVPRRGYRFIAPVVLLPSGVPDGPAAGTGPPPVTSAPEPVQASSRWRRLGAAAAALAALALGVFLLRDTSPAGIPLRLTIASPPGTTFASGVLLSPNGRLATFVARDERTGTSSLWVRTLGEADARRLPQTEGASKPFWSPGSDALGFFVGDTLKKMSLDSDSPLTLGTVGLSPAGGAWSVTGTILYAGWRSPIYAIPDAGGPARAVTTLAGGDEGLDLGHRWPQFLPDGRQFLFHVQSREPGRAGTWVAAVDSPGAIQLLEGHQGWLAEDHLLFIRDRALMAQRLSPDGLRTVGPAREIARDVSSPGLVDGGVISAPTRSLLSFGGSTREPRMQWMDRNGHALGALEATLRDPTFARDGRSVVGGGDGVWLVDLERGAPTRLVQDGMAPWPSPDGLRVAFTSRRKGGVADIFLRSAGLDDEVLLESPEHKIVNDWTADGRFLVYVSTNRETGKDIWLLPMNGARTPVPFLVTPYNEIQAQVSPDGRWLAYASDESGSWEVYVQAFPGGGGKRAISVGGGAQPKWRGDGGELFYLGADRRLMAVAVSDAPIPGFGRPTPMFRAPVSGDLNAYRSHYAVSADGDRFLIDTLDASTNREPITLLVNWSQVLEP